VNRLPKSWIAVVAVIAAIGVLFVLITPAPDELPSTGPHSLNKAVLLIVSGFAPMTLAIYTEARSRLTLARPVIFGNLLFLICTLLC
jgi:hypothetical protein